MIKNTDFESYPYRYIQSKSPNSDDACDKIRLYRFKSLKTKKIYIVRVEEYPNNTFVPKFFLKDHSSSSRKYKLLTHTKEPRKIIQTCMNIMFDILADNKFASFAFVGARSENEEQSVFGSKRWRVYSILMKTYISDEKFIHLDIKEINGYVVLNKNQYEIDNQLKEKIELMFKERIDIFELY